MYIHAYDVYCADPGRKWILLFVNDTKLRVFHYIKTILNTNVSCAKSIILHAQNAVICCPNGKFGRGYENDASEKRNGRKNRS